jgi:hypothetical protein
LGPVATTRSEIRSLSRAGTLDVLPERAYRTTHNSKSQKVERGIEREREIERERDRERGTWTVLSLYSRHALPHYSTIPFITEPD